MHHKEIIKLVEENKLEIAISTLVENIDDSGKKLKKLKNLGVSLKSRLKANNQKQRLGILHQENFVVETNMIRLAILELNNEVHHVNEKNKKTNLKKFIQLLKREKEMEREVKKITKILSSFLEDFEPVLIEDHHSKVLDEVRIENQFKVRETRVFVFGKSNAGKTSMINSLFEKDIFPTSIKLGHTKSLACGSHKHGLIFYDSPGIGDLDEDENVTRAALGMSLIDVDNLNEIKLIDATVNKNEGPKVFRELDYQDFEDEIEKESANGGKKDVLFKSFNTVDFQEWSSFKFDYFIYLLPIGGNNGLDGRQIKFLKELFKTIPPHIKVFKVLNILNDKISSNYNSDPAKYSEEITSVLDQAKERWKKANLPDPNQWTFIEANLGTGIDKLIINLADNLPSKDMLLFERTLKKDFLHLIKLKLDRIFLDYVLNIGIAVSFHYVNFKIEGEKFFSYALRSIFDIAKYIFINSNKTIPKHILDDFIRDIEQSKSYKIKKSKTVYVGSGNKIIDFGREIFGYDNYNTIVRKKKKYKVGGKKSLKITLGIGLGFIYIIRNGISVNNHEKLTKVLADFIKITSEEIDKISIPKYKKITPKKKIEMTRNIKNNLKPSLNKLIAIANNG